MRSGNPVLRMALRLAVAWLLAAAVVGCQPQVPQEQAAAPTVDPVVRGEYLVTVASCGDCHTPWTMGTEGPAPDETRLLSGHPAADALPASPVPEGWGMLMARTNTAFRGPWGTSYAANLTPHETGLAAETEEMFIASLRDGKHFGTGRPILPPMPWQGVGKMSDEDLRAMWAYLRSIRPIENAVPAPEPPAGEPAP